MQIEAHIILNDTLKAIGLKYLLDKYFGAKVDVLSQFESEKIVDKSSSTIYVISPEIYILHQDFFKTKRQRTLIVSATNLSDDMMLTPDMDKTMIIETFNRVIEELGREMVATQQVALSQREIEVLRYVAMGYINKEIAEMLSISFNTVLTHRKNISSKLGIKSASGLGFYAMMNGYISEEDVKR